MVRCVDCLFCIKMKPDVDSRRFFACYSEYQKLLEIDNPERWALFHSDVLEKLIEVNPLKEHECSKFGAK